MTELPKAPITRICKNCGAERISKDAEALLTKAVEDYTKKLSEAIIDVSKHAGRKTIQPDDIEIVLKHFN